MPGTEVKEPRLNLALECLDNFGSLRLRVTGASMLPAIHPGSYVWIGKIDPEVLTPGSVILTRSQHGVRLHRLIAIENSGSAIHYITRGDNNDHDDPVVAATDVLGVLSAVSKPSLFFRLRTLAIRWLRTR